MNVKDVVLSIHTKPANSQIILVKEVLTGGKGTLTEALQGGQATFGLTLTRGHEVESNSRSL